ASRIRSPVNAWTLRRDCPRTCRTHFELLGSDPKGSDPSLECAGFVTRPGGFTWVVVPAPDGGRFQPGPPAAVTANQERGTDPDVRRLYARASGGRRPFRPPDATLEPKDAPLHLHRAGRHLHHRPAADAATAGRGARLRAEPRRARRLRPLRRHEEAEPDGRGGAGSTRRHAIRQPPVA